MKPINLAEKLATFTEHWQPRTVGQFNGHDLMVAKLKGEFIWHKHDDTDDFFLVLSGRLRLELRDGTVSLERYPLFCSRINGIRPNGGTRFVVSEYRLGCRHPEGKPIYGHDEACPSSCFDLFPNG